MIKWPYFSFEDSPDIRPLREKVKKKIPPLWLPLLSLHPLFLSLYMSNRLSIRPPNSFQLELVPACSLSLSIAAPSIFGARALQDHRCYYQRAHTSMKSTCESVWVCVCVLFTSFTLDSATAGTFATAINNKYEQWQTITLLTRD